MRTLRKKGDKYFDISFLAVMIFVLLILLATVYIKTGKLTRDFGDIQKNILDTYYEAEKALFFIDQSAKYSVEQAIYELGQRGGFQDNSDCGEFYSYILWNNEKQECYPDVKENFKALTDTHLNHYIMKYPIIPTKNYEYLIKENNDKITLYGFAIRNLEIDVGKKVEEWQEDKWVNSLVDKGIITKEFLEKTKEIADNIGADYVALLSIMNFETGGTFEADEPNRAGSGALGLIQFLPSTAKNLLDIKPYEGGLKRYIDIEKKLQRYPEALKKFYELQNTNNELYKSYLKFASMTPVEQLDYVELYLLDIKKWKNADYSDPTQLALAVLLPNKIGAQPDEIIIAYNKADSTYQLNKGLDKDKNGISAKEYTEKVLKIT